MIISIETEKVFVRVQHPFTILKIPLENWN